MTQVAFRRVHCLKALKPQLHDDKLALGIENLNRVHMYVISFMK